MIRYKDTLYEIENEPYSYEDLEFYVDAIYDPAEKQFSDYNIFLERDYGSYTALNGKRMVDTIVKDVTDVMPEWFINDVLTYLEDLCD